MIGEPMAPVKGGGNAPEVLRYHRTPISAAKPSSRYAVIMGALVFGKKQVEPDRIKRR
jgi:hypothetical protein